MVTTFINCLATMYKIAIWFCGGQVLCTRENNWMSVASIDHCNFYSIKFYLSSIILEILTFSILTTGLMLGHGFLLAYVMVFFMFNDLRWDVIARFVDIGGFIDHHYLNYLFHIWLNIRLSLLVAKFWVPSEQITARQIQNSLLKLKEYLNRNTCTVWRA